MKFQDKEQYSDEDVEAAIGRNDPEELQFVSITLALSATDPVQIERICLLLSSHAHERVRGNAIMSLGHVARRFRQLNEDRVRPVIESALRDTNEYVRIHAKSAADEIHQFLGWSIAGHVYG